MEELEGYFKALADISRLRIINLLLQGISWNCSSFSAEVSSASGPFAMIC
jgi:hypothetical protein